MTQVVTVHTDFTDLNQMAQGLIGRVNETHVILPAREPVDVGEWVQFAITLYDGSPGFAGVGRCVTFVDNGEERLPHQRFDVVFDSLQFDPRGQQIYSHILGLSGFEAGAGEEAGEPGAPDETEEPQEGAEASGLVDVSSEFPDLGEPAAAQAEASAELDDTGEDSPEPTVIAERRDLVAAMATAHSSMPVPMDEPEDVSADEVAPATRPAPPTATQAPSLPPAYVPAAVNGTSFHYAGGLPFPSEPPRPELDLAYKVTPAPRPAR